jgi:hypothetical protein
VLVDHNELGISVLGLAVGLHLGIAETVTLGVSDRF